MKILITGHKGFIGSHLLELIPEADGVDLKDHKDIRTFKPSKDYTHIFHLAACRSVPEGEKRAKEFIDVNCYGTFRITRLFPNARILNISSSAAEESKSVYGATKLFAEKMGDQHKNCLNVRLYNVFGERQPLESGAVVPKFIETIGSKNPVILRGHGKPTRDFTYVKDVVLELKRLMFETSDTGLAHVGYSDAISVESLLNMINPKAKRIKKPLFPFEIENNSAPYGIKKVHYGRERGILRTVKWYLGER